MWSLNDISTGFKRSDFWLRLAVTDLQRLYQRSALGMAWVACSFAAFVAVKILVFGSFVPDDEATYFSLWLSIGFWCWLLIQATAMDSCNAFVRARGWILGTRLPFSIYIFQMITRVTIRFFLSLPVIIAIMVFYKWTPDWVWLWSIAGFVLIVLNMVWVGFFLGTVSVKFRDVTHLVQAIMQVAFFLTPILYVPKMLGTRSYLLNYNPFTHYIALIRGPIVDYSFPVLAWQVVGTITICGGVISLITFHKMGREIPFRV